MKIEFSLNPNCSEATLHFRTDNLSADKKKALFSALKKAVEKYNYETWVFEDTCFGIQMITVNGDMPYNDPDTLIKIGKKCGLKNEDMEGDEC